MSIAELKMWMIENDKTVNDIAYVLSIHPQTVYRFLQGKAVQRSTKAALSRLVRGETQRMSAAAG